MWFWAGDGGVIRLYEWKNLHVFVHSTAIAFRSIGFLKLYCNVKY